MAKAVAGKDDTLWSFPPPEIYYDLGPALPRPNRVMHSDIFKLRRIGLKANRTTGF